MTVKLETWSTTLREGHRLKVFENRIIRRIFGSKRMRMESGEDFITRNFKFVPFT